MTISTVVGARPQFIKASALSRLIAEVGTGEVQERLIHTGQHYDDAMSDVFFRELQLSPPAINLEVGSGSHGRMTGRMLERIEDDLLAHPPDMVLVYGDTNSTLAGALAASKLRIPVAHVEAGLRSRWKGMPEEQNRILTDHLADVLFAPTDDARKNLECEGITKEVHVVGDVMLDVAKRFSAQAIARPEGERITRRLSLDRAWTLMTLHRVENTDDHRRLREIILAVNACSDRPIVFPVHPRTRKALAEADIMLGDHVIAIDPVGYIDMIELEQTAGLIVTDSGGVQKEAYFFGVPCITVRDQTEWSETLQYGWNRLIPADHDRLFEAMNVRTVPAPHPPLFGYGDAASRILEVVRQFLGSRTRCERHREA